MMFNATLNNISVILWHSLLFVGKPEYRQGLTNPLARRPGLIISTFGLAEIISCMCDRLVKKYIGY